MSAVGLLPALAVIAGAAFGTFEPLSPRASLLPALCALAALLAWRRRRPSVTVGFVLVGFSAAGVVLAADARTHALHSALRTVLDRQVGGFAIDRLGPEADHDPVVVQAVLQEDAAPRDGFVSLRARVSAVSMHRHTWPASGGVSLTVSGAIAPQTAGAWRAGRVIRAPVTFRRPARYLNDGVPDFERELALGGTTLFGSVKSALLVEVAAQGSWIDERAADVRVRVRRTVTRWIARHDRVAAGIVTAVLIGDRTGLPDEVRNRLQAAGTYHVIAISGGNIAILAALALGVFRLAGVHGRAAALAAILVLLAYSQVATAGPSVWRATLMAMLYLGARLLDHRTAPWQAASVAAALMVAAQPLDIRDPGFVLTFGATAALLEGARRGHRLLPRHRVLAWIAASLMASLAAEVTLLPVSAQLFSRVTSAGLLLNLVAVPMMGVAQVAGLVVAAFDSIDVVAAAAGWVAYLAAVTLVESARLVDVAPWLTARVPPPGAALLAAYYGALLGTAYARSRWIRLASVCGLAACLLTTAGLRPFSAGPPRPALRLTLFDVGQGESMLLETAGAALQIDAGGAPFGSGAFDIGARVLAPALWARGVRAVQALLLTHGDPDHIGGAATLLTEFGVARLWEGIEVPRHQPSLALRALADARQIPVEHRRSGETLDWGHARLRVLHPPVPDWERPRVRNDDSVVLEVRYGDVALLLTGDVSAEVERAIRPRLTATGIRVLKVGHHGSRTSTSADLLDAWRPHIALISAGRGNTFGHPAPEVLRRLESAGARVYRTDRHGQITLETDGRRVTVRTFVGHRGAEVWPPRH